MGPPYNSPVAKTLLVTGGLGFMGSDFVRTAWREHPDWHIIVLDALTYAGNLRNIPPEIMGSPRFEFWYGNVVDTGLVSDLVSRADYVVHYAAETHVARSLYNDRVFFETDVLGTQSVASAVYRWADRVERFVYISTSEVYGSAQYEPMDEEHPIAPTTPYAAAKAGADRLVWSYIASYSIPGVIIRPLQQLRPPPTPGEGHSSVHIQRDFGREANGSRGWLRGPGLALRGGYHPGRHGRAPGPGREGGGGGH